MANLSIALDTGGIFREVDEFPVGTASDGGITGVVINGKKGVRNKRGVHSCEEVGIFANGLDQTARINTVYAHAKIKKIDFTIDGGGAIVINGTVNIPTGKVLNIVDGTMLAGSGTVNGGKLYAADTTQVVATGATLTLNPFSFSSKTISPMWWGMRPGTNEDHTPYMQKAVDLAANNDKIKLVQITEGGTYNISNLLIMKNRGSTNSGQTCVSIDGSVQSSGSSVIFYNSNRNSATIHMQQVIGSTISKITFDGGLPYNANFINGDWTAGGTVRTNGLSPFTAISVDGIYTGFDSTLSDINNRYPGLRDTNVYANTHYAGSTNITIKECSFQNFYVAISNGLSGCVNGEGIRVTGGFSANVKTFWAAGQLQSRENVIDNHYFYYGDTFISNVGYGNGIGDLPSVNNCNINQLKYLFQSQGDQTSVRFTHGYSESIWSLGKSSGNTPVNFTNWNLSIMQDDAFTPKIPMAPVFVETRGAFSWSGGKLESVQYLTGFPLNCQSAEFTGGVFIRGQIPFQVNPDYFDRVNFSNVFFTGYGGTEGLPLNENENHLTGLLDESAYMSRYLLPGSSFSSRTRRTYENVGNKIDRQQMGSGDLAYPITINAATNTLTFTPDSTDRFGINDYLVCNYGQEINNPGDVYAPGCTYMGIVSAISDGVITLKFCAAGLVNGASYSPYLVRVPRFIPRTLGTTQNGSNMITNIIKETFTFQVGDFIKGQGLFNGTRVLEVTDTTIKISMVSYESHANIELYDAKIKMTTDNKSFFIFGGNYKWDLFNHVLFAGDEILNLDGSANKSLYVTQAGKMNTGTAPALSVVGGPDPNAAKLNQANTFLQSVAVNGDISLGTGLHMSGVSPTITADGYITIPSGIYVSSNPSYFGTMINMRGGLQNDSGPLRLVGGLKFDSLPGGTGTRMLTVQEDGTMSNAAIPAPGAPTTDASQLTTGTLPDARLSSNVPLKNSASNIFTGTLQSQTLKVLGMAGAGNRMVVAQADGTQATQAIPTATTDASQLITGTLPDARHSSNIPTKDAANNIFTGALTTLQNLKLAGLTGGSSRMMTVAADGSVSAQAIPSGGSAGSTTDEINITSLGVLGNGTDETAAVKAAIIAANGKTLVINITIKIRAVVLNSGLTSISLKSYGGGKIMMLPEAAATSNGTLYQDIFFYVGGLQSYKCDNIEWDMTQANGLKAPGNETSGTWINYIENTFKVEVKNSYAHDNGHAAFGTVNCSYVTFDNNWIVNTDSCIFVRGYTETLIATRNKMNGGTSEGIGIFNQTTGGQLPKRFVVSENMQWDKDGFAFNMCAAFNGVIAGNEVSNCRGLVNFYDSGSGLVASQHALYNQVIGNDITDCDMGINNIGSGTLVAGNNFKNIKSFAIGTNNYFGPAPANTVDNTPSEGVMITGNNFYNICTASASQSGPAIWLYNLKNSTFGNNNIYGGDLAYQGLKIENCDNLYIHDINAPGIIVHPAATDYSKKMLFRNCTFKDSHLAPAIPLTASTTLNGVATYFGWRFERVEFMQFENDPLSFFQYAAVNSNVLDGINTGLVRDTYLMENHVSGNSGTTGSPSITSIARSWKNRVLTLKALNANSFTITTGNNIQLATSPRTISNGASITLKYDEPNNKWREQYLG